MSSGTKKKYTIKKKLLIAFGVVVAAMAIAVMLDMAYYLLPLVSPPTVEDADRLIDDLNNESDRETRAALVSEALDDLGKVEAFQPAGEAGRYTFERIENYFRKTQDVAILEGLDSAFMDCGWANNISGLYYRLKNEPAFIRRYRTNKKAQKALERCVGLSFSKEEYSQLVSGQNESNSESKVLDN